MVAQRYPRQSACCFGERHRAGAVRWGSAVSKSTATNASSCPIFTPESARHFATSRSYNPACEAPPGSSSSAGCRRSPPVTVAHRALGDSDLSNLRSARRSCAALSVGPARTGRRPSLHSEVEGEFTVLPLCDGDARQLEVPLGDVVFDHPLGHVGLPLTIAPMERILGLLAGANRRDRSGIRPRR